VSQTVEPAAPKDPVVHLADTLEEVARSVDHLNVKFKLRVLSTAVEAAILVVVLVLVWQLRGQAQDLTDIAVTNQRNGRAAADNTRILTEQQADTNRILSAVESVTSDGARAASRENSAGLLAEVDCAGRRRQARLPAVTPGACRQNTPPEVYPGIEGEPLRPLGG
jgi:hypothetical protein